MIQTIKNAPTSRPILELFVVDIRSLALLRIGLALVTLIYLIDLLPDIELFLSDDGLLPISLSKGLSAATNNWDWSLYWLNGSVWFNRALVTTHIIVALMLLFGFQTRTMTFCLPCDDLVVVRPKSFDRRSRSAAAENDVAVVGFFTAWRGLVHRRENLEKAPTAK